MAPKVIGNQIDGRRKEVKKSLAGFCLSDEHLSKFNCLMNGRWRDKEFRVTCLTMAGHKCGPAGVNSRHESIGSNTIDTRLTLPAHLQVSTVLGMRHWIRFATDEEQRLDPEKGWWRHLEFQPQAIVCGHGDQAILARSDWPIGCHGPVVIVLSGKVQEFWVDKPVEDWLVDAVSTPPTPPPRSR